MPVKKSKTAASTSKKSSAKKASTTAKKTQSTAKKTTSVKKTSTQNAVAKTTAKKSTAKATTSKKAAPTTAKKAVKKVASPSKTAPTKTAATKAKPKTPKTKDASTAKKTATKTASKAKSSTTKATAKKTSNKKETKPAVTTATSNEASSTFQPYVAKRSEDYMNDEQKDHFRKILNDWKSELMDEVDRTVSHMKDEASNFPDPADRASQEEEFSLELRTRDRERKLIKKIDSTLELIEIDDYGYCEACGVEIGVRRLEARPTATLCIDCKTLDEIKERQEHG